MVDVHQQATAAPAKELQDRAGELLPEGIFRLVFEKSLDPILLIDDGKIVGCNQSAAETLRYASQPELLSLSVADLSPKHQPDGCSSSEKLNEMIATALAKGSCRFDWIARRADQTEFPVEVLLTAVTFKERQLLHAVWRDIARQKDAEKELSKSHDALLTELRASEERFAKVFKANPHPMSLARLEDGRVIEVNDSLVELTGYARSELIGRTSLEFLWEAPLARAEVIKQVRERGLVRNVEARIRTRAGATRLVLLSSIVIVLKGKPYLLSVGNDITEDRRAEDQLRLLQAITMEVVGAPDVDSALEVVLRLVCETTGWVIGQSWIPRPDGTAIECGPVWFCAETGLEEFRRCSVNARFPPGVGLPGRVWRSKQAAWVRDVTLDSNFPRVVVAQEAGLRAALALPIIAERELIAVIEFFMREPKSEDERLVKVITAVAAQLDLAIERKRAEEQLRRTQAELAHVARVTTMGELAASIAHEVNQPLGAIVGNADICLAWLDSAGPDLVKLREAVEDIAGDGRRASEIIARIRSLVRRHAPEMLPLDLSDVAREVLDLVSHEAQSKQVALLSELGTGLPPVAGDRVQLQQVLLNLVINAFEAMSGIVGRKPELTLRTERFEEGVLAMVSDCGIGIELDKIDQIFKPFHTTKSGGMGMGLAISRSIIEAHGGRLWAEPNKPAGSIFKFTLPTAGKETR